MHFKKIIFLLALGAALSSVGYSEAVEPKRSATASTEKDKKSVPEGKGFWETVWGQTPENNILLGMWTLHFNKESRRNDNWQNNAIGIQYKGINVATFSNSFYEQVYVLAFSRQVYVTDMSENSKFSAGYRVGGMYGYDGKLGAFADKYPIVPLVQIYTHFQYKRVGIEFTYTGIVASASFYFTWG